jgi:V/A-type H+-transporting ATPase subunit I
LASGERSAPTDALAGALDRIRAWSAAADAVIDGLDRAGAERTQLDTLELVMLRLRDTGVSLSGSGGRRGPVDAGVFVYATGTRLALPADLLLLPIERGAETFLVAAGATGALATLTREITAARGRPIALPDWLRPSAVENLEIVSSRRQALMTSSTALREQLEAIHARHDLASALGAVMRAAWCIEHVGAIEDGEVLSRITGWTSDRAQLLAAIEASESRALVRFPPPPRGVQPPLVLRNPAWVRPFELFGRLFGMPGQYGADPSLLLALVVPLLFGYMFGDVGQGLVLVAAGLLLKRRLPLLALLVPAGLSAAAFGLLYGSVFGIEGAIHPLWMRSLDQPLTVLAVPLVGGAILLAVGIALSALEAHWRGELRRWLVVDGGFALAYLGILGMFFAPAAGVLALVGTGLLLAGQARIDGRASAIAKALGELAERLVQILINTLSFARVGAFALAHAGLSSAIVALAGATGSRIGYVLVLVVGNVVVLVLEGLVVSVQTTRLVLFEFFIRFFRAEGREFRPLRPPMLTPPQLLTEER